MEESRTKKWAKRMDEKQKKERREAERRIFTRIDFTTIKSYLFTKKETEETKIIQDLISKGLKNCSAPIFSPCKLKFTEQEQEIIIFYLKTSKAKV